MTSSQEADSTGEHVFASLSIHPDRSTSLLDLPTEILKVIFNQLSQHDHTICARVNTTINSICIPLVWSTIDIGTYDQLFHFPNPAAIKDWHCGYVKYLYLSHKNLFCAVASQYKGRSVRCTNLRHLYIYPHREFSSREMRILTPDQESSVLALVQQNRSLSRISIRSKMSTNALTTLVLTSPRSVRELRLAVIMSPQTARFLLDNLPEQIQTLSLYRVRGREEDSNEKNPSIVGGRPRNHHALKSLEIYGAHGGFEKYLWLPFLTTCGKNLTVLHGLKYESILLQTPGLFSQLGVIVKKLEPHHFPNEQDSSDSEIANIISLDAPWTCIDLSNCRHAGPKTVEAILRHCLTLEIIYLSRCELLSNADFISILGSTRKLWVFDTNKHVLRRHDPSPTFLTADDMLGLRWGSFSLSTFSCPIKVPRANKDVEERHRDVEWSSSVEHSREAQRQVFQQLSRLTRLRVLRLGDTRGGRKSHHAYQWYSLDMTLESGMDELEGLKNLEILDVRMMNHDIGIQELEWMNKCWPRLRCVLGLIMPGGRCHPYIEDWLESHSPGWTYK